MSAFDRISKRTPAETKKYVKKSLDIVDRIQAILKEKGMTQKDLAEKLNKKPSEISRWMTGLHNFGFKTLMKIETALQEEIIEIKKEGSTKRNTPIVIESYLKIKSLPENTQLEILDFIEYKINRHKKGEKNILALPQNN